jgi:hypothetical protein
MLDQAQGSRLMCIKYRPVPLSHPQSMPSQEPEMMQESDQSRLDGTTGSE